MARTQHARSTRARHTRAGGLRRTKRVRDTAVVLSPARHVDVRVGPEQVAEQARVWHLRAARTPPRVGGRTGRSKPRGAVPCPMPRAAAASPLYLPCISPASPLHLPYSPDASSGRFSAEMSLGVTRFGERPPSDGREGVSADVSWTCRGLCRGRVVGVSWACCG